MEQKELNDFKYECKTWDWLISGVKKTLDRSNLPEDKKEIIIKGYEEIKDLLGKDILEKSSNSIRQSLRNFAPWQLLKNADFGEKLGILKSERGFKDIKQRLIQDNFENSYGAEAEIEVVGDLRKKGIKVELIDQNKKITTPDFKLKVDNKWIYFEITTFRTYPEETNKTAQFCSLLSGCINQICQTYGRFIEIDFNGMSIKNAERHFYGIIKMVSEMVQSPQESENTVYTIRIKILDEKEGYGLPYIHSIKRTTDEMYAISRKFLEKLNHGQLPVNESGILLIYTRSPFLQIFFSTDFQILAEQLLKFISGKPNVIAAVIQYICLNQLHFPVDSDNFKIIHRIEHGGIYNRYNIIISKDINDECIQLLIRLLK